MNNQTYTKPTPITITTIEEALDIQIDTAGRDDEINASLARNERCIIATTPGAFWFIDLLEADNFDTPEEYLDDMAEDCWQGEWPRGAYQNEYAAWEIKPAERTATAIVGHHHRIEEL